MMDEQSHMNSLHESFVQQQRSLFVGRTKLTKECIKVLGEMRSGVIALPGKPGTGKSALMVGIFALCLVYTLQKTLFFPLVQ